jgi:two-component system phosphate regulon response regulator PhoB
MKTILVIEDDADVRELISWKLGNAGYAVLAEADGEAGLRAALGRSGLASAVPPDLVLVDWMMPGKTGIEVCQALREDPATAHIPVIILTAKGDEEEVERGFAVGADDYIVKPFSPRELLVRVQARLVRTTVSR